MQSSLLDLLVAFWIFFLNRVVVPVFFSLLANITIAFLSFCLLFI